MARKYGRKASENVRRVMHERKTGQLRSGSGRKVTSRKQAIAIGLSEARREGDRVPGRPTRAKRSKSSGSDTRSGRSTRKSASSSSRSRSGSARSTRSRTSSRRKSATRSGNRARSGRSGASASKRSG